MKLINIITPCSRINNLHKISESINIPKENYRWIVVYDSLTLPDRNYIPNNCEFYLHKDINSVFGNGQRNYALDLVEMGHIYFNDDDTLIHQELWDNIKDYDEDFISFIQSHNDSNIRLNGDIIKLNHIDSHNFITSYEIVGDVRFELQHYNSDGIFAVNCYERAKTKRYINKSLSIYNQLR
jgi:hypothetical protein